MKTSSRPAKTGTMSQSRRYHHATKTKLTFNTSTCQERGAVTKAYFAQIQNQIKNQKYKIHVEKNFFRVLSYHLNIWNESVDKST